ncbi:spore germination protein KC [Salirhabdus euzebyi]|uniref:Spore germination protein KC n=1 Tax=Salirhabdus euzebyi TaxID=394506 RepID=A0A841Q758_9BACI|nr:Ger(x)C family spore germination protein [Salirhabdus euzebyi]MBB6454389.1 spore germination protein KC [Salirhabdus euzebyi]
MFPYIKIIFFLVLCSLLVSCGFKDIDKRSFVVTIGIDKPENKEEGYDISLKIALPSSDPKTQGEEFIIHTETARTVSEAVRLIKAKSGNELDFGHMKMIVFGEKLLQEDITQIMDWFTRRRDIQKIAFVGSGKPTAKAILELKPKGERLPSNKLFLFFGETGTESPYVTTNYLFHFYRNLMDRGIDPYLPIIETKNEEFEITTMSVLKNGKNAIVLDKEETKTFNVLNREYDKVNLKIEQENIYFMLSVDSISAEYTIVETKNIPYIEYDVNIKGIIEESLQQLDNTKIDEYSKMVEDVFTTEIQNLLEKFQEKSVDPMGFGLRYRATHNGTEEAKWKKWQSIYPALQFRVKVQTDIKSTGIIE